MEKSVNTNDRAFGGIHCLVPPVLAGAARRGGAGTMGWPGSYEDRNVSALTFHLTKRVTAGILQT
jgi:hypothetical protein